MAAIFFSSSPFPLPLSPLALFRASDVGGVKGGAALFFFLLFLFPSLSLFFPSSRRRNFRKAPASLRKSICFPFSSHSFSPLFLFPLFSLSCPFTQNEKSLRTRERRLLEEWMRTEGSCVSFPSFSSLLPPLLSPFPSPPFQCLDGQRQQRRDIDYGGKRKGSSWRFFSLLPPFPFFFSLPSAATVDSWRKWYPLPPPFSLLLPPPPSLLSFGRQMT